MWGLGGPLRTHASVFMEDPASSLTMPALFRQLLSQPPLDLEAFLDAKGAGGFADPQIVDAAGQQVASEERMRAYALAAVMAPQHAAAAAAAPTKGAWVPFVPADADAATHALALAAVRAATDADAAAAAEAARKTAADVAARDAAVAAAPPMDGALCAAAAASTDLTLLRARVRTAELEWEQAPDEGKRKAVEDAKADLASAKTQRRAGL